MKNVPLILLSCFTFLFVSCSNEDDAPKETAVFAVPVIETLAAIRSNVSVTSARQTNSEGKIYVTEDYLFYIAKEEGVHVFDNQNPASPQNIAFINLEGVHDIAVKGNHLYADNFVDLLVFDISDINNIALEQTLENAVAFSVQYPSEEAQFYDYSISPQEGELVTGFRLETRERPDEDLFYDAMPGGAENTVGSGSPVGTAGSYAKFQINKNALYTVSDYDLKVFNIATPTAVFFDKSVYMNTWFGGGIFETLFRQGDYLFIGATNGMHVVNAEDEFNPYFLSGFSHATACDPVVVDGTTAYITVRGGSICGAIEDQVNVIDITDIANPALLSTYLLSQPYGLGIRNNILYVCSATEGLEVFDASNTSGLELKNSYDDAVKDVIPLESHLIAVGSNKIIQYNYGANFTLELISEINF